MKKLTMAAMFLCIGLPLAAQETNGAGSGSAAGTNAEESGSAAPTGEAGGTAARTSFFLETAIQYADEGEYEEAERAYLRALEKDPEDDEIRYRLSVLYMLMQRYKEAEPIMKELHEDFPESSVILNNLAWLYATGDQVKNSGKALIYARRAILIDSESPSLWNTLAESYYVAGQYDKSLRAAEEALELLRVQNAEEEKVRAYTLQLMKIKRAQEAVDLLKETGAE